MDHTRTPTVEAFGKWAAEQSRAAASTEARPMLRRAAAACTLALLAASSGGTAPSKPSRKRMTPDPNAPVVTSGVDLRHAPYRPAGFDRVDATFSGSIHSPLPGGVFFKNAGFQKEGNDGRLYFIRFLSRAKGSFGFVTWTPLDSKDEMAQRAVPIPTYSVQDFETDGTVLRIHHYPPWPQKKAILIQEYRWQGDDLGRGRFVLRGTRKGELAPW